MTFSWRFLIYSFLICLSSYAFVGIFLFVALLNCVGVFAYNFCDFIVAYHSVGGDGLCGILDFLQDNLAELSKENDVDDVVLEL